MKYILMMNTMRAGHGVPEWPHKDLQAHVAFMMRLRVCTTRSGREESRPANDWRLQTYLLMWLGG
jgi:hypothetical protein